MVFFCLAAVADFLGIGISGNGWHGKANN